MPWSPTRAFPHPLANIQSSNAAPDLTNFISYVLVEMLTTQGLGDLINRFREYKLGLEPLSLLTSPGLLQRLKIPYTYCWSPSLIPKPKDWGQNVDISGFYFLSLSSGFRPDPDLESFLDAGPPPIYIGFGSIVVDDPTAMTEMIFKAVKLSGTRALVSKGWGGLGADKLGKPDDIFMLGNVPHDWLFSRVACVVHHGGAGTTAAGIAAGKPTVIVPFFGDQAFWGSMIANAGAGPDPVPYSELSAERLAIMITTALEPASLEKAKTLAARISAEKGTETGAESFQSRLHIDDLRCMVSPTRAAAWHVKSTKLRLSPCAASVLNQEGLLDYGDLRLHRAREYDVAEGPWEPITGAASALMGTVTGIMMGVGDFPREIFKAGKKQAGERQRSRSRDRDGRDPDTMSEEVRRLEPPPGSGPDAQADSLSVNTTARGRSGSASTSRSRSPSAVSLTPPPIQEEPSSISLESIMGAGKGVGRIVGAGLKSPMDFTMALAKGFHNAPKLYGDDTVRPAENITGVKSGLMAASRGFGFGVYDGITGLITQPLRGAEKDGAVGLIKGIGKGVGGLILKPGAAIWGLPGYAMTGVYKEIQKNFGSNVQNYLIAARTTQGQFEAQQLSTHERTKLVTRWKAIRPKTGPGSKGNSAEELQSTQQRASGNVVNVRRSAPSAITAGSAVQGEKTEEEIRALQNNSLVLDKEKYSFRRKLGLSFDERKRLAEEEKAERGRIARLKAQAGSLPAGTPPYPSPSQTPALSPTQSTILSKSSSASSTFATRNTGTTSSTTTYSSGAIPTVEVSASGDDAAFEDAIRESVQQTSKGNPHEDELIARALRQSVAALRQAQAEGLSEEEALDRSIRASTASGALPERHVIAVEDLDRSRGGGMGVTRGVVETQDRTTASMAGTAETQGHPRATGQGSVRDENSDGTATEDRELSRAKAESLKTHAQGLEAEEALRREDDLMLERAKKQSLLQ